MRIINAASGDTLIGGISTGVRCTPQVQQIRTLQGRDNGFSANVVSPQGTAPVLAPRTTSWPERLMLERGGKSLR